MKALKVKLTKSQLLVKRHAKEIRKMLKNEGKKGISAKMIANT